MNFEFFIAQRIIASKDYKSSISAPIIKIAITAIVLSIIMMLVSIATTFGLQKKIREKVSAFNGDIIISNFDTNFSNDSQNPISKNQDFYPTFKSIDGIKHVQVTASKGGVIRTETDFEGVVVKGVGEDYDWEYFKDYLVEGKLPDFTGDLNEDILISEYLANRLHLKLGDKVTTFFLNDEVSKTPRSRGFDIVGIYNSGFQQFDEQFVLTDIRHIQRLNKWEKDQVGAFEVFVNDFDQIVPIGNAVYNETGSTLDTQTIRQKYASIFEWIDLFDFNIALIIGIMILVAGINMITALLVLILERTQMIGILKALGSSDWSVRKIFLYNAMYLIGVGLFWGNVIGIGLLLIQKYGKVFKLNPDTYYVNEAPVYLHWDYILILNAGTFLLCLLMLLIPSFIISKISPVRAIRFE
ncbi:ABC-type transport system, involved in lipoprotein release, permease component [Aequorivita sublithincola DSM 14238]|uniref:ABC-type transport system, involved in lipoprotein release, permease component n=1 Tax=Aequorivita sublithincola (strain DSM 14238 / LMG 21431 / ACAM 643 / 9-3) TaxID=746697 RepID=I3YX16_AEQSU|nr:FtsX-like permease family protein [Aequorivita sublithincola]AFL81534.1 ABC-type transport system, involved in lipoprotein release, permease component [Aequorivita sublithincola DSM 14238]